MFKIQFKPEVSAGQVMVAVAALGTVVGVWRDVSVDMALIKQTQAQQGKALDTVQIDIRELRREARGSRAATPPSEHARGG